MTGFVTPEDEKVTGFSTPEGEKVSDFVQGVNKYVIDPTNALASGIVRGTAGLAGIPGSAYSYVRGKLDPSYDASQNPMTISNLTEKANELYTAGNKALGAGNAPDVYYEGEKGSPAYYAGKIGEFMAPVPGGGETKLLRDIIAPAVGSTVASDLGEKYAPSWAQPYLPIAGALAGHRLATGVENAGRAISGSVAPEAGTAAANRAESISALRDAGVPITAGTAIGDRALMAKEASTARGAAAINSYPEAVTHTLMGEGLGVRGLATPENVSRDEGQIVGKLTSIADSVSPVPVSGDTTVLKDAVSNAAAIINKSSSKDFIDDLIGKIDDAAANGTAIPGEELRKIRTQINRAKSSMAKDGIGDVAQSAVDVIDNMVERELAAAGRTDDLAELQLNRYRYRNLLSMQNALKGAYENNGILNPSQITAGLFRQGKGSFLRGARGDFSDLATHAANLKSDLYRPVTPDTGAGFAHDVTRSMVNSGVPYALTNQMGLLGIPMSMALEYGLPYVANKVSGLGKNIMMTQPAQAYLERRGLVPEWSRADAMRDMGTGLAASLAARQGRKTGGRVGSDHEDAADQLVRDAERAKKALGEGTKPLLNETDNAVAHALEIANRSI